MLRLCHSCRAGALSARGMLVTTAAISGNKHVHSVHYQRSNVCLSELPPKQPRTTLFKSNDKRSGENKLRLSSVLQKLTVYKSEERSPTPLAYINIIQAASDFALAHNTEGDDSENLGFQVALAAWEDAKKGGLELGQEGIDAMMGFGIVYPHLLPSLLLYSKSRRASTYNVMARISASSYEVEQMIYILESMSQQGFMANTNILKHSIRSACEWGYPRLALQIAQRSEAETKSGLRLDKDSWVQILIASADSHYLHGIEQSWDRVKSSYTPDEGLILSMLHAAGRWGRPDFSSSILQLLSGPPQEHHLAPLLEAFCNAGEVPNAFQVLTTIREAGLEPTMSTVQPIVAVLKSVEVIDQAFYTLEDMHKAGKTVDITALNSVIAASTALRDLQRTRATQMAAADLALVPNLDTYNLVLQCCAAIEHRPLGDVLLSEMTTQGISANATTYEHMIRLCLTQPSYEDAFYYLEKMKADGFKPSYDVYTALIEKCVALSDSRWRLVVEEMRTVGYKIDNNLQEFINSGGRRVERRDDTRQRRTTDEMVGSKRRSWIQQAVKSMQ
nr:hypothetical protein L204_05467 [Cryptococcus depauperatus CBS 7855]